MAFAGIEILDNPLLSLGLAGIIGVLIGLIPMGFVIGVFGKKKNA